LTLKGSGNLPSECPSCHKDPVDWDWSSIEFNDEGSHQIGTCPHCNKRFFEISNVVEWEQVEEEVIEN